MESHDRTYLDVLRRVRGAPLIHLGEPSLKRLRAFHFGYCWFRPDRESEASIYRPFADWVRERYRFETRALDGCDMLNAVAESDQRAFDLFFADLDIFLLEHSEKLKRSPASYLYREPIPASAWLQFFIERPAMYLPEVSVECLRAHFDGYSLAALENGNPECADLSGFENWIRKQLDVKGSFRWETLATQRFRSQQDAFDWAINSLLAFRESGGPLRSYSFDLIEREESSEL